MIERPLTEEALEYAQSRLEDFYEVQRRNERKDQAFTVLRTSMGLDETLSAHLKEWVESFVGPDYTPGVLLGLVLGLIAADHES